MRLAENERSCYFSFMGKGKETRNEIIAQALRIAHVLGLEGLSIGVLASATGLSKSGLFAHFKSKEALQLEVLNTAIDEFVQKIVSPALGKPCNLDRLQTLFANYIAWIREYCEDGGCIFMSFNHELDDRPGAVRDRLFASQGEWRELIARLAEEAVGTGEFRRDLDPYQFAFEFMGIARAYDHAIKVLKDERAGNHAARAFESLILKNQPQQH
jgi:AcrR family transcriptional regulator